MAALTFAATAGGAAGDSPSRSILVNGDFSRGVLKRPWNELHPGSQAIPGWRVLRNVDYVPAEYWQTSGGTASVDLDGSPGPGELAQDFPTVPGHTYRVAFDLAANADGPPRVKTLLVSVAGTTHRFAFDQTGHSNRSMGYVRESFDFTAPGTSATLDFASLSRAGNWNGPVIAEVSVVELSPPEAAEAAVATPLRAPSPAVTNAPQTPAPETRAPETRAPVVALAPRPHRVSARPPVVPLAGLWRGDVGGTPIRLLIREQAGVTIAAMVDPDPSLGLAKLAWDGSVANGRILALQICQRTTDSRVLTYGLVVRVLDANRFVLERNNCLDRDVIFTRAS